jgi:hypothetical protein
VTTLVNGANNSNLDYKLVVKQHLLVIQIWVKMLVVAQQTQETQISWVQAIIKHQPQITQISLGFLLVIKQHRK